MVGYRSKWAVQACENAAHRADDVGLCLSFPVCLFSCANMLSPPEFAFEISSGLLTEVRRLQSVLAERDKPYSTRRKKKTTWTSRSTGSGPLYISRNRVQVRLSLLLFVHRSHVDLHTDKFKEENWNFEVTLQELHTRLSESDL